MPNLDALAAKGERTPLIPSFPCVTWPVQSNMVCGSQPKDHGVVANGFFWRDTHEVEMWTAWNDKIQQPQVWDILEKRG
ncbi:MAG: alkaline phosphatase family protein, partial [Planctomycetota bacterium]|nr:alkaline phosphatase family protein [Planctomycetota bacterium]